MRHYDTRYVSEFAHFMEDFLAHHPEIDDDRQRGRSMYWDKKIDPAGIDMAQKDQVPIEGGYYYFGHF